MKERTVAIIQARMASSRLPGKVLMDLEGRAVLARVMERTRRATALDGAVLATTTDASDNAIVEYCRRRGIRCIRGSHFDVLDRYYTAARQLRADVVVRITADCPLIDPALIDDAVHVLLGVQDVQIAGGGFGRTEFDFVANRLPPPRHRTYPIGLDAEVCTFDALERAWREAREPEAREHVMPYLYDGVDLIRRNPHVSTGTSPRGFRIGVLDADDDHGSLRWTVDTADDLEFVRQVYRHFGGQSDFSWLDVLKLLDSRPELRSINANVTHKSVRDTDERAPRAEGG
ncbi:MAG: glycosyltransferase family protein [Chloroflexota bacterium]